MKFSKNFLGFVFFLYFFLLIYIFFFFISSVKSGLKPKIVYLPLVLAFSTDSKINEFSFVSILLINNSILFIPTLFSIR